MWLPSSMSKENKLQAARLRIFTKPQTCGRLAAWFQAQAPGPVRNQRGHPASCFQLRRPTHWWIWAVEGRKGVSLLSHLRSLPPQVSVTLP